MKWRAAFDRNLLEPASADPVTGPVDPRSEARTIVSLLLSIKCGCQNAILSTNWGLSCEAHRPAERGRGVAKDVGDG